MKSPLHVANNKPERGAPSMVEISCYFSRAREKQESAKLKEFETDHSRPSPSRATYQTRTDSIPIPQLETRHIRASTGLVTAGMSTTTPRPRPSMASGSMSYFTWSGSKPRRRELPLLCPGSIRGLAPSYAIDMPKPLNAQCDAMTSETAVITKVVPGPQSVLPAGARRRHSSSPSHQTHHERKGRKGNDGEHASTLASPRQLNSAQNRKDTSRRFGLQPRKTVATQTSPGLLRMAGKTTINDAEELCYPETDSSTRLRAEHNTRDQLEAVEPRDTVDVWQNHSHLEGRHEHVPYDIDELIDSVEANASMRSPMVFPHHQTWATPSHVLTRGPLYPQTEGQTPLFGLRKQVHAQSAGTFRGLNDSEHPQQSTLPFAMSRSNRDLSLKATTITSMGRNLWTCPQRRLPSVAYGRGICSRIDDTSRSPALYRHEYPLESIETPSLRTQQTPLLGYAELSNLGDQIEPTRPTIEETAVPEDSMFWRPNKLY